MPGKPRLALLATRGHVFRWLVPLVVLLVGGVLATAAFASVRSRELRAQDEHLDRIVERTSAAIMARIATYEDALRSGVALFAADGGVTGEEWRRFSASLDLMGRYPGVNGIGVIFPIRPGDAAAFEANARATIDPLFRLHSLDQMPGAGDSMVITYIEPFPSNREARGLDIGSEPNRRVAAERARDTGRPAITQRITLVQDATGRPGFLMYVPIYTIGPRPQTVDERRARLVGWVYAPFVTEHFLEGVLGSLSQEVRLEVLEMGGRAADPVVYTEGGRFSGSPQRTATIGIGGQRLALHFERGASFPRSEGLATWVAIAIVMATLVLAFVAARLQAAARRGWDVALTRQLELALAASRTEAAERAAEHRGEIVNLASHELRNPLSVLSLSAELLEMEAAAIGVPELAETARAARTAAGRAEALVAELLDLNRIDSGRLDLDLRTVHVAGVLREVSEMTVAHWGERKFTVNGLSGFDRAVLADPLRLKIILRNLVDNAAKFSPTGAEIAVSVQQADGRVSVTVHDGGPGVAPGEHERVFDRFRRGKAAAHVGGIGIGLYLSRELARRMAGDVELLASERGARFRLTLPAGALALGAGDG